MTSLAQAHRAGLEEDANANKDDDHYGIYDKEKRGLWGCCWWRASSSISPEAGVSTASPQRSLDFYYNPIYWPGLPIVVLLYLQLAQWCRRVVVDSPYFANVITFAIVMACLNVGIQTYPDQDTNPYVVFVDWAVIVIFSLELALKICMEGFAPSQYFVGPDWRWNCFDATIIILSYPIPIFIYVFGGNSIMLLRLVRLARLGKLIKRIPALRMIIKGLIAGLSSIKYVIGLLILVFYLYAVVGFYLFSSNDPFHFGSLPMAMLTLFRVACLDNWGDIMFLQIFGCSYYPDMYVPPPITNGTASSSSSSSDNNGTVAAAVDPMFYCLNPQPSYVVPVIYFISFVIISALIMLSLFIGAVTVAMIDSMEELKILVAEEKAKTAKKRNELRKRLVARQVKRASAKERERERERESEKGQVEEQEGKHEDKSIVEDEEEEEGDGSDANDDPDKIRLAMKRYPLKTPYYLWRLLQLRLVEQEAAEVKKEMGINLKAALGSTNVRAHLHEELSMKLTNPLAFGYSKLAKAVHGVISTSLFSHVMTLVILASSIIVGAQTDYRVTRHESAVQLIDALDILILIIFTGEIVLKFIALEFQPLRFFRDNFNNFDLLVVVASWIPGSGGTVIMLRLLRLLRVLKLIKSLPQLAVMINALYNGLKSIGYIGLVLALFFYVMSIIAMLLFQDSDPWHFGSLHIAFLTLFSGVTLDSWTYNCYTLMFGCDVYHGIYNQYPEQCTNPKAHGIIAPIFYIVHIIIGTQVLLSLFIGVISTSMDDSQATHDAEDELGARLHITAKKHMLTPERVEAFRVVFDLLDIDKGGRIDLTELMVGMDSIGAKMSVQEIMAIVARIDPDAQGLDVHLFILFMLETPFCAKGQQVVKMLSAFTSFRGGPNGQKKKKKPRSAWLWWRPVIDFAKDILAGGRAARLYIEEMEAALLIQDAWAERKAAKTAQQEAKATVEAKQRELLEKRLAAQRALNKSAARDS